MEPTVKLRWQNLRKVFFFFFGGGGGGGGGIFAFIRKCGVFCRENKAGSHGQGPPPHRVEAAICLV